MFGRRIKDPLPHLPGKLKVSPRCLEVPKQREDIMLRCHIVRGQELNKHTRELAPLNLGEVVVIQNQHRTNPIKWDNTGRWSRSATLASTLSR